MNSLIYCNLRGKLKNFDQENQVGRYVPKFCRRFVIAANLLERRPNCLCYRAITIFFKIVS